MPMPYTHRTLEQRAALERQAKALCTQGASMAAIERGGWRGCDLAKQALEEASANRASSPSGEGPGWADAVSEGAAMDAAHPTPTLPSRGGNRPGVGESDCVSADQLRSAGERALAAAL